MENNLKREIILDNYNNPFNKNKKPDETYKKINTSSTSCIDDLDIYFKIEKNIIKDVTFKGEACAISTSATSIFSKKIIGKNIDELKELITNYKNMIEEKPYNKELLGELLVYDEIYQKPNRKGCALIPVKAIERLIEEYDNKRTKWRKNKNNF